jgi:hypothetical protein
MNLTEEWGKQNLNLEGSIDVKWAQWKRNELLKDGERPMTIWVETRPLLRADIWNRMVTDKVGRMGIKYPEAHYETRFRKKGAPDPRTLDRNM